ncbi:MAG: M23 family metallopeptidase [Bradymonadaceae bacterium]|nr:M23 family metallopeptidase [Lujinxingiaceae bacterium]
MEDDTRGQSAAASTQSFFSRQFEGEDKWELWAKVGLVMLALQLVAWLMVFLKLGVASVYAHALGISLLGTLTLPVVLWGLVKTLFNPPALRRSRTVGFGALIVVGVLGNVPLIAPPLSTQNWVSEHAYRLPFDGEWTTLAGGPSRATNYHATTATFRWGYDFALMREGRRFTGTGARLEEHHCFGQPVLASAPGKVVTAVDFEADNKPGEPTATAVLGNHVVIEVGPGEYLFFSHLRQNAVPVKKGEQVERGQKIGECGNSGRSVEPHVHVHLQNSLKFPFSESLPLRFSSYEADAKPVALGMPEGTADSERVAGQSVKHVD